MSRLNDLPKFARRTQAKQSNNALEAFKFARPLHRIVKRLTVLAYSHGYISFEITQQIFSQFNLRED